MKELADKLSIDDDSILAELRKLKRGRREAPYSLKKPPVLPPLVAERKLLQLMLEDNQVIDMVKKELKVEDFWDEGHRQIVKALFELEDATPQRLINYLQNDGLSRVITNSLLKPSDNLEKGRVVRDCIKRIEGRKLKRRRTELQKRIKEAEDRGELGVLKELLLQYQELMRS